MTTHDPLCRNITKPSPCAQCALIARVRADEREWWGLGWVAAADNVQAVAHAEAVAARLVEVIVQDEHFRRDSQMIEAGLRAAYEEDREALDAARADGLFAVGRWQEAVEAREQMRAEVSALNVMVGQWMAAVTAHEKRWADLRAKVEALPEEWSEGRDMGGLIWKADVIAMFDEVSNG